MYILINIFTTEIVPSGGNMWNAKEGATPEAARANASKCLCLGFSNFNIWKTIHCV